ncbi:hypothetical protein [Embleya scabrispora]|uniref:hypothetical protein n=1 Tax=Embleya scabrispora TaxID=159449 RepID=UPI000382EF64|nr:hypothetical protein [Embleya scabrispora]MYS82618.1 hypothetical protein [Streptomyces sp. SID5474]
MTHTRRILAAVLLAAGAATLAAPVANADTSQDIALNTSDPTAPAGTGPNASDALNTAVTSLVGGLTS